MAFSMPTTALEAPNLMAKRDMKEPDTQTKENELKKLNMLKPRRAEKSRAGESGAAMASVYRESSHG
jgi:hypothetical protein